MKNKFLLKLRIMLAILKCDDEELYLLNQVLDEPILKTISKVLFTCKKCEEHFFYDHCPPNGYGQCKHKFEEWSEKSIFKKGVRK